MDVVEALGLAIVSQIVISVIATKTLQVRVEYLGRDIDRAHKRLDRLEKVGAG